MRNRSDHAVSGRQNSALTEMITTIMTAMASSTLVRFPSLLAAAT